MGLLASTLFAMLIMFVLPGFAALIIQSDWNQRRLNRARKYRARHGTPWWIIESDAAQRQRKWIERERDRADRLAESG